MADAIPTPETPLFNKLLEKIRQLYPDLQIVLWTKAERGNIFVNDHKIIKNINLGMMESLLKTGDEDTLRNMLKYYAEYIETRYVRKIKQFEGQRGRKVTAFTEAQIRYAIANSKSNSHAARFLNVTINTYRKYARIYGLYEGHQNRGGRGIPKGNKWLKAKLSDVFAGKYPEYHLPTLKERMIKEQIVMNECSMCGEKRQRVEDGLVPLLINFVDGNHANLAQENLRLICYNCAFLTRDVKCSRS
jgi:hypothetical protein